MALLMKADGTIGEVLPKSKAKRAKFTLEELQGYVGGYIERVQVPGEPKHNMIVNEEGRLRGLPVNHKASELMGRVIVGDVVICKPGEM